MTPPITGQNRRSDSVPKPKPDQVIRYEVVLGSTERQIIKDMRTAYVFNRVSSPMVDLAEDLFTSPRALATFLTFLGMFVDIPYFPDFKDLQQFSEQYQAGKDKADATPEGEDRPDPDNLGEAFYNVRNPNWTWGLNQQAVDDFFRAFDPSKWN